MSTTIAAHADLSPSAKNQLIMAHVQDVRGSLQRLRDTIQELVQTTQLATADGRAIELKSALRTNSSAFVFKCRAIEQQLFTVWDLLNGAPLLYMENVRDSSSIRDGWRDFAFLWMDQAPSGQADASTTWDSFDWVSPSRRKVLTNGGTTTVQLTDAQLFDEVSPQLPKADVLLHKLIVACESFTVPSWATQTLKGMRVGTTFDFNAALATELPDAQDRAVLLARLADSRKLPGVIDLTTGQIHRISLSAWRRWFSYAVTLILAAVGAGLAWLLPSAGTNLQLDATWPFPVGTERLQLGMYVFVVVGGITHILIDGLKQQRAGQPGSVIAMSDWLRWVYVNELKVWLSVISIWIGYLLLAYATRLSPNDTVPWGQAFFVGYSIDSVIDLFLQRFAAIGSTGTQAALTALGGALPAPKSAAPRTATTSTAAAGSPA